MQGNRVRGNGVQFDRAISAVAVSQYGLITRQQAFDAGATSRMIQYRLTTGRLVRLYDSVYRLPGAPESWEQALLSVCLTGKLIFASHGSAARLFELAGFEHASSIEVTIPRGRWSRYPGVICHESGLIEKSDITVVKAIPATTIDRTLIDLAAVVPVDRLEEAVHDALRRRLLSLSRLRWKVKRMTECRRPGIAAIRGILDRWAPGDAPTGSPLETQVLRAIREYGLPPPLRQYPIREGKRLVAVIDFAYPNARLGIEADGYRYHSSPKSWERDTTRANFLTSRGWRILRVTSGDLKKRKADFCEQIARALGTA